LLDHFLSPENPLRVDGRAVSGPFIKFLDISKNII